ncbi:hypothetical protein [Myroides odoratimimus]|nr:hypothetical protein [Myroides odoratimimus]MDM1499101.1 hypothetical protein [Myroides odoratimimus]
MAQEIDLVQKVESLIGGSTIRVTIEDNPSEKKMRFLEHYFANKYSFKM